MGVANPEMLRRLRFDLDYSGQYTRFVEPLLCSGRGIYPKSVDLHFNPRIFYVVFVNGAVGREFLYI